jgi:hypothetical protein
MKYLYLLFVITLITACASLSEKDCKSASWSEIGKKDGSRGMSSNRLGSHTEACAEYGITPNVQEYKSGYTQGKQSYCTNKGTDNGKNGRENKIPSICKDSTHYKMSFKNGYKVFCESEGVSAGKNAKQNSGRANCIGKSEYKKGFSEGLKSYCTQSVGLNHGKNALDHKASLCPSSLRAVFMSGYKEGIEIYCTRMNGFKIGQDKGTYRPTVCPSVMRGNFESAYKKGIEYKSLQVKIDKLNTSLSDLNTKINNPETSSDLKAYLSNEVQTKGIEKNALEVRRIKIEGFIGI